MYPIYLKKSINFTAPANQKNQINPFHLSFLNTDSTDSTDFFRKAQQATQVVVINVSSRSETYNIALITH